jgi:hypothetical protein
MIYVFIKTMKIFRLKDESAKVITSKVKGLCINGKANLFSDGSGL